VGKTGAGYYGNETRNPVRLEKKTRRKKRERTGLGHSKEGDRNSKGNKFTQFLTRGQGI